MAERDRKMVKHIFEMKENYNKFRQLFRQQAEDLLKKLDKHAEEKQKSVMHDMMDEWSCFCKGQDKAFVCRRASQKTSRGNVYVLDGERSFRLRKVFKNI